MPRITPLSCRDIERKLLAIGFELDHVDGAIRYYCRAKNGVVALVQVHFHPGDKDPSTISAILRTGKISRHEWLDT